MIFSLPGCDVRKNHPEAVGKMTAYMEDQVLRQAVCCRKDLGYIGEDDEIIQNCTLCDLVLRERLPENTVHSLYEFLLDTGFDFPDYYGRVITVQDCWRTRNNRPLQDAVRECLRLGKSAAEFHQGQRAQCHFGRQQQRRHLPGADSLCPRDEVRAGQK